MNRLALVVALVGCSAPAWRPPSGAEMIAIYDDTVVRREEDGVVSVVAWVTLDGASAAGFTRLPRHSFETAASSPMVDIARGRAWQVLARRFADQPERMYEAAHRGVLAVSLCDTSHASFWRRKLELTRAEPERIREAASKMLALLDRSTLSCLRRYRGRAL
ncbi:MAG: hypothetical protein ACTHU0_09745 [Kofleriaceae bacterium]